jgi:hypothetical protein
MKIVTLGVFNTASGADGILSKDELTRGSYCHKKFPAMRQSTLDDNQPALKDSSRGDVIDFYFYGPCDENPVGKDQVQEQKRFCATMLLSELVQCTFSFRSRPYDIDDVVHRRPEAPPFAPHSELAPC